MEKKGEGEGGPRRLSDDMMGKNPMVVAGRFGRSLRARHSERGRYTWCLRGIYVMFAIQ
jgi:hypothetical protein